MNHRVTGSHRLTKMAYRKIFRGCNVPTESTIWIRTKIRESRFLAYFRGCDGGCVRQVEAVYQEILAKLSHQSGFTIRPYILDITRFTDEAWFHLSGYGTSDTHCRQLPMPHPDTPGVTSAHDVIMLNLKQDKVLSMLSHRVLIRP